MPSFSPARLFRLLFAQQELKVTDRQCKSMLLLGANRCEICSQLLDRREDQFPNRYWSQACGGARTTSEINSRSRPEHNSPEVCRIAVKQLCKQWASSSRNVTLTPLQGRRSTQRMRCGSMTPQRKEQVQGMEFLKVQTF